MRLATFNVLHGQAVTGPESLAASGQHPDRIGPGDPGALAAAISALDAEVIGIQEADVDQPRSGAVHQPELIANVMDAPWWRFVPTVLGTPGGVAGFASADATARAEAADGISIGKSYGIALVSKLPVIAWHTQVFACAPMSLPLLVQTAGKPRFLRVRDEQRAAIAVTLEGKNGPVTVATAHLSFVPGYNVHQLRKLKAWLANLPRPLVLMGDFNLPWQLPPRITRWQALAREPTFPSYRPRVQLDHILVDGAHRSVIDFARTRTQAIALPVSDHCALRTEIDI